MTLSIIHEENKERGNQIAEFHGKVVNSDMRELINKCKYIDKVSHRCIVTRFVLLIDA